MAQDKSWQEKEIDRLSAQIDALNDEIKRLARLETPGFLDGWELVEEYLAKDRRTINAELGTKVGETNQHIFINGRLYQITNLEMYPEFILSTKKQELEQAITTLDEKLSVVKDHNELTKEM